MHACLTDKRGGKGAIFMEKDRERMGAINKAAETEPATPGTTPQKARKAAATTAETGIINLLTNDNEDNASSETRTSFARGFSRRYLRWKNRYPKKPPKPASFDCLLISIKEGKTLDFDESVYAVFYLSPHLHTTQGIQ